MERPPSEDLDLDLDGLDSILRGDYVIHVADGVVTKGVGALEAFLHWKEGQTVEGLPKWADLSEVDRKDFLVLPVCVKMCD